MRARTSAHGSVKIAGQKIFEGCPGFGQVNDLMDHGAREGHLSATVHSTPRVLPPEFMAAALPKGPPYKQTISTSMVALSLITSLMDELLPLPSGHQGAEPLSPKEWELGRA